jgi:hypothetical protein
MRSLSKIFAIGVLWMSVAAGCGGSSDSPPGPLGKHLDDMYIAQIPLDQKQSVVQTQNDWSLAKMENAKAEADVNEVNALLSVVQNDYKASRLGVDSAVSNKKTAETSADNNRINQAAKELHAAEALSKAAEARVRYYEAYRDYLKRQQRWAQENMYWREAQYELAKAQLAQKSNISPKGVSYEWFPSQESDRNKRTASAKGKADSERQKAMSARDSWLKQQDSADKENGRPNALPDPMAPKAAPSTSTSTSSTSTSSTTTTPTTGGSGSPQ